MCGIAGIYYRDRKVDPSTLKLMGDKLIHRGPDNERIWISEKDGVGFSHRRLSIIDLSENGNQPMHYQDRYTMTFNGEIYNYIELKKELQEKGYQFKTQTDTEVLMALYADMGSNCLQKIDGMFAFALWDDVEKELFLARDRFGEKPLYYSFINGGFCFASEMKALFAIGASKETSPARVHKYLEQNALMDEEDIESTFYKQVKQVDAACFMIVKQAEIRKRQNYWNLSSIKINHNITVEEAAAQFRKLFATSIKRRMRSDVTVGSSLSGGIDSSSIVLIANTFKETEQRQNTFSARFKNFSKDEGAYIDMVINKAGNINPHNVWPDIDEFIAEMESLAYHQEEPFYSGSVYNQYCVMRLAKEFNTTVLLDGQGADEQLGGYIHYYRHHLTNLITTNPHQFLIERKGYQHTQKEIYPYSIPKKLPLWYMKKILFRSKYAYDDDARSLLIRDTTVTGLKTLLRYGDRNSMAFSREVRLPFLSHELTEFIFSLPIKFVLNEGWTKYVLRKAVEDIVPPAITWRKDKVGFEPPQEDWIIRLQPLFNEYKAKINYLDLTGGRKVNKQITDWKWLMLKLFIGNGH